MRINRLLCWLVSAVLLAICGLSRSPTKASFAAVNAFQNAFETAGKATSGVIVLFETPPAARFRAQLGPQPSALTHAQQEKIRAYASTIKADHAHFLQLARSWGVELEVIREYTYLLNGLAVSLDASAAAILSGLPGVSAVWEDSAVHLELNESVSLIGADLVWQMEDEQGRAVTGQGVHVAVIDTGIDYTHPDLGGCFGAGCKVVGGYDLRNNDPDPLDDNGHGTHCAGVVSANGTLKGVAPGASLLAYKVLDAYGYGSISTIIAGIEMAADPDQDPATGDAVEIISMSLGYSGTPGDPWSLAIEAAAEQGILVAAAAGNRGPSYASLDSPGLDADAFTVGASDKSDIIALFSSRGPVSGYPEWIKPDILAPGVAIVSTWLSGEYASASGTSMATPHVAGAAALVWQAHPDWTAEMVRANLMNTAVDLGLNVHMQGAGRVQVDAALNAPAVVTPGSLGLGLVDIHQAQWTISKAFQITNGTGASRSYTLSLDGPLQDGITAALSTDQVALAAGQTAAVTLTIAMAPWRVSPDLDRNQGQILIQSAGVPLAVPFAFQIPSIYRESRSLPYAVQTSYAAELGDLDGDGDLDAFIGNTNYYSSPANTVWFNDGSGAFADSGQRLGSAFTWAVALGDLDGDGDLDAFSANSDVSDPQPNQVWLNNGDGFFIDSGQRLGNEVSRGAALADLDGDGDLDAFIANGDPDFGGGEPNTVWLNDGSGTFADSGQRLGNEVSRDVALGDLDGDGDLDAFVANGDSERGLGDPDQVWLNNGSGRFTNSGQSLGSSLSQAAALGDLDGDGDLDAFIANGGPEVDQGQPDQVWLNNGAGVFSDSGLSLGCFSSFGVGLADLNGDGSLDAFVAGYSGGNKVWLNDGSGHFSQSCPGFGTERAADVALGDVDADGDVDALLANAIGLPNRVWFHRGFVAPPAPPAVPSSLSAAAISPTQIDLTWEDNATDESEYRVERSPDGMTGWTQLVVLPAGSESYSDTGLACGSHFYYRVRAYRAGDGQVSAYSNNADAATSTCSMAAPTDLTAAAFSLSQVNLSWQDHAGDESAYRVERQIYGEGIWVEIADLPADSTHYADNNLACGTRYDYRVRAYRASDGQVSAYSNEAYAVTRACPNRIYLPGIFSSLSSLLN